MILISMVSVILSITDNCTKLLELYISHYNQKSGYSNNQQVHYFILLLKKGKLDSTSETRCATVTAKKIGCSCGKRSYFQKKHQYAAVTDDIVQ